MLLRLGNPNHNRAVRGIAEICRVTCPRSRHLQDRGVSIIDSSNINSNVLSPRRLEYAW